MSNNTRTYPDELSIQPLSNSPCAKVRVPGSKSITNRALVLGALSAGKGTVYLSGGLLSEDTDVMIAALRKLGVDVRVGQSADPDIHIRHDTTGRHFAASADLFVANSGTTMRFLTAMVSLFPGRYRLDGIPRMRERPIEDLLIALRQLGVQARSEAGNHCPPVVIEGTGWKNGRVVIRGDISSQFLSGLLMSAPFAPHETIIEVDGPLVSVPYVEMTVRMIEHWYLQIHRLSDTAYRIPGQQYGALADGGQYSIEPDASAASYFWAVAGITRGEVMVVWLNTKSLQGDVRFVEVLEQMGCRVVREDAGIIVQGRRLHGIDVDMNAISDTVMTLAAVACFAKGPTTIRNVAHIRHKETDRLAALATELRKVGAEVEEFADGLKITPRPLHGAVIDTYNDHRMAMSMALIGLKVPGIVIRNPGCVAKTYPGFWDDLERLRTQ
jgi:3-phosphoshikimate 1-carboxyvinyltransferase